MAELMSGRSASPNPTSGICSRQIKSKMREKIDCNALEETCRCALWISSKSSYISRLIDITKHGGEGILSRFRQKTLMAHQDMSPDLFKMIEHPRIRFKTFKVFATLRIAQCRSFNWLDCRVKLHDCPSVCRVGACLFAILIPLCRIWLGATSIHSWGL